MDEKERILAKFCLYLLSSFFSRGREGQSSHRSHHAIEQSSLFRVTPVDEVIYHSIWKTKPDHFIFIRHHRPGAHPPLPSRHSHHTSSPAGPSNYRDFVPIMTSPSVHTESPHHITTHHQVSPVLSIVTSWIIV